MTPTTTVFIIVAFGLGALALAWLVGLLSYIIIAGVSFALGTAFPHAWDWVKARLVAMGWLQ